MVKLNSLSHSLVVGVLAKPLRYLKFIISLMVTTTSLFLYSCKNPSGNSDLPAFGKANFADTAISTIRYFKDDKGRQVLEKNNTYYDMVELHDSIGLKKILFKVTKSETDLIDSGTSESHFVVNTSSIGDTKPGWKREFSGSDIDYTTNKVLVVHSEARAQNEEDTYTQYSLMTGEKLMTYTYAPLSVFIVGDGRYLGYLSQQSATDKPNGFAEVSYVSRDMVIDKVNIKLKGADTTVPAYTPELKMRVVKDSGNTLSNEGRTVVMGGVRRGFTAKDINNFAMEINFTPAGSPTPVFILLPIRNDRLDLDNAAYDKAIFVLSKSK